MFVRSLLAAVSAVTLFTSSISAQTANGPISVPSDLSGGFQPDALTLQVSFDNQSDDGIANGAKLTTEQTANTPTFAFGDASGVNTAASWVIFMVDTTSDSDRVLHYVQSDFKATEDKTAISSSSQPQLSWHGPGTLGDSGSGRTYTFLLYEQEGSFSAKNLPSLGQPVDVQQFVQANGLPKAIAGVIMQVDVAGASNAANGNSDGSSSSSAAPTLPGDNQPTAAATLTMSVPLGPGPAVHSSATGAGASGTGSAVVPPVVTLTSIAPALPTSNTSLGAAGSATATAATASSSSATGAASREDVAAWGYAIFAGIVAFAGGLAL